MILTGFYCCSPRLPELLPSKIEGVLLLLSRRDSLFSFMKARGSFFCYLRRALTGSVGVAKMTSPLLIWGGTLPSLKPLLDVFFGRLSPPAKGDVYSLLGEALRGASFTFMFDWEIGERGLMLCDCWSVVVNRSKRRRFDLSGEAAIR